MILSECPSECELEFLDVVTRLVVDRQRIAELQWPDRRIPVEADTPGVTQGIQLYFLVRAENHAAIDEQRETLVLGFRAEEWNQQFGCTGDLAVATQRSRGQAAVLRTK